MLLKSLQGFAWSNPVGIAGFRWVFGWFEVHWEWDEAIQTLSPGWRSWFVGEKFSGLESYRAQLGLFWNRNVCSLWFLLTVCDLEYCHLYSSLIYLLIAWWIFQFATLVSLPEGIPIRSQGLPLGKTPFWDIQPASLTHQKLQISVMALSTVGVDRFYIFRPVAILIPAYFAWFQLAQVAGLVGWTTRHPKQVTRLRRMPIPVAPRHDYALCVHVGVEMGLLRPEHLQGCSWAGQAAQKPMGPKNLPCSIMCSYLTLPTPSLKIADATSNGPKTEPRFRLGGISYGGNDQTTVIVFKDESFEFHIPKRSTARRNWSCRRWELRRSHYLKTLILRNLWPWVIWWLVRVKVCCHWRNSWRRSWGPTSSFASSCCPCLWSSLVPPSTSMG